MKTYKERFVTSRGLPPDTTLTFDQIVALSGMPRGALIEVYRRGIGAWKSNPASVRLIGSFAKNPDLHRFPRAARLGRQQWAMARVYSFVMRSKSDFEGADRYIAEKYGMLPKRPSTRHSR